MSSPSKPVTPRMLFALVLLAILVMVASSVAIKTASNVLSEATSTEAITQQVERQPAYTKTTKQTSHLTLGAKGVIISGSVDTVVEVTTNDDQAEALGGNNARTTSLQTF